MQKTIVILSSLLLAAFVTFIVIWVLMMGSKPSIDKSGPFGVIEINVKNMLAAQLENNPKIKENAEFGKFQTLFQLADAQY